MQAIFGQSIRSTYPGAYTVNIPFEYFLKYIYIEKKINMYITDYTNQPVQSLIPHKNR